MRAWMINLFRRAEGVDNQHRRVNRALMVMIAIVAVTLIAACAQPVAPVATDETMQLLPFLKDGKTNKDEILERFGAPRSRYENDAIFIYGVIRTSEGQIHVSARGRELGADNYDLVLVFGANDLLGRHTVVRMN